MKAFMLSLCSALAIMASAPSWASPQDLAMKNGCMGCHAVDKKLVGPAYKDVAAKYKGKGPDELVKKVKAGGSGVWGPTPMPPSPASEAEVKAIVEWILTQ